MDVGARRPQAAASDLHGYKETSTELKNTRHLKGLTGFYLDSHPSLGVPRLPIAMP